MCTVLKRRLEVSDIVVLYYIPTNTYYKGIVIETDNTSVPYNIQCPDVFKPLYGHENGWLDVDGIGLNYNNNIAVRIVKDRDNYEE